MAWNVHGAVTFYDGHSLAILQTAQTPSAPSAGALDPTGSVVAIGTPSGELDLIRSDGTIITRPRTLTNAISVIAFSPDGHTLAVAGTGGVVQLLEPDGQPRAALVGHAGAIMALQFSYDSELVATASADETVRLWTATTGTPRGELTGHVSPIDSIAFRRDGARIATASWDHRAIVWDTTIAMEFRAAPTAHVAANESRTSVKYSPDGRAIGLIAADGALTITAGARQCRTESTPVVSDFAWNGDGTRVGVSFARSQRVEIVDAVTCAVLVKQEQPAAVTAVAISAHDQLAIATIDGLTISNLATGATEKTISDFPGTIRSMRFLADGRLLAITYDQGKPSHVVVEALDGARPREAFDAGKQALSAVLEVPTRSWIVASSYDAHAWIWNETTGALVAKLEASGPLWGIVVSPDGRRLVGVGGNAPTVWDCDTTQRIGELRGHTDRVESGAFLDNELFVTAGLDGYARVWDMTGFRPILTLSQAVHLDGNGNSSEFVLSDSSGAHVWAPSFPLPDSRRGRLGHRSMTTCRPCLQVLQACDVCRAWR